MILRPYQEEALAATLDAFREHRSVLVVKATGLGKTVFFAALAAGWGAGKVLVLAHREELISQARDKLAAATGGDVAVEMAQSSAFAFGGVRSRVVAASVQTLSQPARLARFDPHEFGLVVIDEAHHAVANSYRRVIDHFAANPDGRLLGVTATPRRADELAMGQVFGRVAFDYGIEPAIEDGWLVPVRQRAVRVEGLDFSKVRSTAGDLNEADLEAILAQEEQLHKVVAPSVEMAGDQPALVFAVTVKHAQLLAAMFGRYKPGSALALSGKTEDGTRRRAVADFRAGRIQFLCNCGLFLEGFDAPSTAVVVMARPTKSLPLYVQVLGRGTRPLPGVVDGLATPAERKAAIAASGKPGMLVLDFVGNSGRHKIVTAQDVLGGRYGTPVREYARKTAEQEGLPADVAQSLERARDELAWLEELTEHRRRAELKAKARYAADSVSPFAGGGAFGGSAGQQADPATDKQVWYLVRRCGWREEQARRLTKRQASGVIAKARAS